MRIQYFNGGLANQVFQYIFYRYGQLTTEQPQDWFLDDSFFFFKHQHNGYELERVFGLKPNLLSQQFSPDAWQFFVENRKKGIGMADNLASLGFHVSMVAEAQNYKTDNPFSGKVYPIPCNEYHPEILLLQDEIIYYFGYWIHRDWLYAYRELLTEELTFPAITEDQNLQYAALIKSTLSVGIHIRRGDYIRIGLGIDPQFYHSAAEQILSSYPEATFFIFSDDTRWCKQNADILGLSLAKDTVFIEGNMGGRNYVDMQLLSMCKGMIISNSAFSYLAALLDTNLEFFINLASWRPL